MTDRIIRSEFTASEEQQHYIATRTQAPSWERPSTCNRRPLIVNGRTMGSVIGRKMRTY